MLVATWLQQTDTVMQVITELPMAQVEVVLSYKQHCYSVAQVEVAQVEVVLSYKQHCYSVVLSYLQHCYSSQDIVLVNTFDV